MSIRYAILGLLSWQSFSGYDLKKRFADSALLYWSGNNNQIYRSLIQLDNEGLVTSEIQIQESLPAKKNYSITEKGLAALKEWVLSEPELPEFHNTFLIQLAWAQQLDDQALDDLLQRYEKVVEIELLMQKEKLQRGLEVPERNEREAYIWQMLFENIVSTYVNELSWVRRLRDGLKERVSR